MRSLAQKLSQTILIIVLPVVVFVLFFKSDLSYAQGVFQNITISTLKDTSVVIKWEVLNTASIETFTTSQIEYGIDINYNLITPKDDFSFFHRHEIFNLTQGTTYHFRIKAIDYAGNEYFSTDQTFTTLTQSELDKLVKTARADKGLPKKYYVSTVGLDTNDGLSIDTAFKTISKGMSVLDAGDTLKVEAGNYIETAQGLVKSGIPTHPIILMADGDVILEGNNNLVNGFYVDARKYKDWKIDGFTIQNYSNLGIYAFNTAGVARNFEISNNTIKNTAGGISVPNIAYDIIIRNNQIYNITGSAMSFGPSGFYDSVVSDNLLHNFSNYGIKAGGPYSLIENNTFINDVAYPACGGSCCPKCGFSTGNARVTIRLNSFDGMVDRTIRIGTGGAYNVFVYKNTILNSGIPVAAYPRTTSVILKNYIKDSGKIYGTGPSYLRIEDNTLINCNIDVNAGAESGPDLPINSLIIKNNYFIGGNKPLLITGTVNGTVTNNILVNKGLQFGITEGMASNNITVSNNTFYNNSFGIYIGKSVVDNLSIKNNIFSKITGYSIDNQKGTNIIVSYNNIHNSKSPAFYNIIDSNALYIDPLFIDPTNNDFHLQDNSPLLTAGEGGFQMGAYGNITINSIPTPTPSLTPTSTPTLTPTPTITPTPAPKLSADLNSDGKVNSQDFAILMSAWNSSDKPKADINQDGLVDSLDFGLMMSFWG